MKRNKGFTLIELLVVIAIIGILSAIVLASLSGARNKANDARVISELNSMRVAAEIYSSINGSYATGDDENVCSSGTETAGLTKLQTDVKALSGGSDNVVCSYAADGSAWAYAAKLPSSATNYWCVDSTGTSRNKTSGGTPYNVVGPNGRLGASPSPIAAAESAACQ